MPEGSQVQYLSVSYSSKHMKATVQCGVLGCASFGANAFRDVLTSELL